MARLTKAQLTEQREAITTLRTMLKPGDTVYCILRHISKSGMLRTIDLCIVGTETRFNVTRASITNIGYLVAQALGQPVDRKLGGVRIGGCGMDMGFALVYNLGRTLYPKGFELAEGQHGRNGDTTGYDNDGGYALTSRWL